MILYAFCFLTYLTIGSSIDALVQNFYWRDYAPGDIPCDAYEGAPGLYIGQFLVKHETFHFNLPATIYAHTNIAAAELYGKKTTKENIKILCSPDNNKFYWEYVDFSQAQNAQLKNAVKGGSEGNNLFIGKILHDQEWKISKILCSPDNNKFYWEYVDFSQAENAQLKNAVKGGSEGNNVFIGKILHDQEWKISKVFPYEAEGRGISIWVGEGNGVNFRQFFLLKYNITETCNQVSQLNCV